MIDRLEAFCISIRSMAKGHIASAGEQSLGVAHISQAHEDIDSAVQWQADLHTALDVSSLQ